MRSTASHPHPVRSAVLGLACLLAVAASALAEPAPKPLAQEITKDTVLAVHLPGSYARVGVSATVHLKGHRGHARLILSDVTGREYQLFETNALLAPATTHRVLDVSEEAHLMDQVRPVSLRLEVNQAEVEVLALHPAQSRPLSKTSAWTRELDERVARINRNLAQRQATWRARVTEASLLSYAERKALFGGRLPDLQGFEHYSEGYFEPNPEPALAKSSASRSPFANTFSWRNRHGRDWVTPARNQNVRQCGSCWAFGAAGATEILVNLHFNRPLNYDLSEQELVSCSGAGSCGGGSDGNALKYIQKSGLAVESCYPYKSANGSCSEKCSNPTDRVFITGTVSTGKLASEDSLKSLLLRGPISCGWVDWNHVITLIGYRVVAAGDTVSTRHYSFSTVQAGSPSIGKTAWQIKNSFGTNWGQKGFGYLITRMDNLYPKVVQGPVQSAVYGEKDVVCEDADKDGYCNWGIGARPATCGKCQDEPDGDDSNASWGPMDRFGHLKRLAATYLAAPQPAAKPFRLVGRILHVAGWEKIPSRSIRVFSADGRRNKVQPLVRGRVDLSGLPPGKYSFELEGETGQKRVGEFALSR